MSAPRPRRTPPFALEIEVSANHEAETSDGLDPADKGMRAGENKTGEETGLGIALRPSDLPRPRTAIPLPLLGLTRLIQASSTPPFSWSLNLGSRRASLPNLAPEVCFRLLVAAAPILQPTWPRSISKHRTLRSAVVEYAMGRPWEPTRTQTVVPIFSSLTRSLHPACVHNLQRHVPPSLLQLCAKTMNSRVSSPIILQDSTLLYGPKTCDRSYRGPNS